MRDLGILLAALIVGGIIALFMAETSDNMGAPFVGFFCILPAFIGAGLLAGAILRSRDRARANAARRVIEQVQAAEQQQLDDQRRSAEQEMEDILRRYTKRKPPAAPPAQ